MDKLLKEFELLSLPSRVNLESLSDDCIDKLLENLNLFQVFEALKFKGDGATPFQWRKLRETCLISKSLKDKEATYKFIIEVYEEAFKFNLKKEEMAECHISISKLIDFYEEQKEFNHKILGLIILFRFYYTETEEEGRAEVAALLRNKISLKVIKSDHIQSILKILSSNLTDFKSEFDDLEMLLIVLIKKRSRKSFIMNILKSYPMISVAWIQTLLNANENVQELIKEETGQLIELNETREKFIIKKRKQ